MKKALYIILFILCVASCTKDETSMQQQTVTEQEEKQTTPQKPQIIVKQKQYNVDFRKQRLEIPISISEGKGTVNNFSKWGGSWIHIGEFSNETLIVDIDENVIPQEERNGFIRIYSLDCWPPFIDVTIYQSAMELDDNSANSYVVATPGNYKIKAVKGNSKTSVGAVKSVEVLWESFGTSETPSKGDIIKSVSYRNGEISYSTPSSLKNGNALIAARNNAGEILWSWHIWVCEGYDPFSSAQNYYNNAGTVMDRNLGATSATPGEIGALGLLYQWGRKDPFLGGCQIKNSSQQAASTSDSWSVSREFSTSINGAADYSIKHPMSFIVYEYANIPTESIWGSRKTIYDPCPSGWRVLYASSSDGLFRQAFGETLSGAKFSYDSQYRGINFSGQFGASPVIWYPAAGSLENGSLVNIGKYGEWWLCWGGWSPMEYYRLDSDGRFTYQSYSSWATGRSVRCQKEE